MRHLLKCDLFRVVQDKDSQLTPANKYGAATSIFTGILLIILLVGEFRDYARGHRQCSLAPRSALADLSEDELQGVDELRAVVTFPYIPCSRLRAEVLDDWGREPTEVAGRIVARRYPTPAGDFFHGSPTTAMFVDGQGDSAGTGCMINVTTPIPSSSTAFNLIVEGYDAHNPLEFRSDHIISFFRLGSRDVSDFVPQVTRRTTEPLTGTQRNFDTPRATPYFYFFIVQYVRTQIVPTRGPPVLGYQHTVEEATIEPHGHGRAPGIYMVLKPSPYSLRCTVTHDTVSHFIVNLCAVVGGVYTVASFLELGIEALAHHRRQRERAYEHALNTEKAEKQRVVDEYVAASR